MSLQTVKDFLPMDSVVWTKRVGDGYLRRMKATVSHRGESKVAIKIRDILNEERIVFVSPTELRKEEE